MPYELISASSHLAVGAEAWRDHVDSAHRDALSMWQSPEPARVAQSTSGADPVKRLEEMDRDGVDAEVLFPAAVGPHSLHGLEPEAQLAAVRGYNDWLSKVFTVAAPERLLGVALLPATRLRDAIDELERAASLPGIVGVLLQQWPNGSGTTIPSDDRFWEAAVELRVPLCAWWTFGEGAAAVPRTATCPEPFPIALSQVAGRCQTQSQLIIEGVLDRVPSLQILFAGLNVGWLPDQIEQADDMFMRHRFWGGFAERHTQRNYFPKHFMWTFTDDPFGVKVRHDVGVANMLWSSDFPHDATTWPNSRQALKEQLADVSDEDAHAMLAGNAITFFHLDN